MHSEESVLICGSSDDIGENPEFEGEERCVSEVDSSADLEESDEEDDPFCQRFVTHQLCHLDENETGMSSAEIDRRDLCERRDSLNLPLDEPS